MAEFMARQTAFRVARRGEIALRGSFGSGGVALGRLYRPEELCKRLHREAVILCLFDACDIEAASRCSSLISPSGVLLSSRIISPELLNFLIASRLPYLIFKDNIPNELLGHIALLDSQSDALIVDPDIDTLNGYASLAGISENAETLGAYQSGVAGLEIKREAGGGVLARSVEAIPTAELFDALLELAEELCGAPLTLGIDVSSANKEAFFERIEAIFRAAVYGNFSLQLEGYRGEGDISLALKVLHRVFCSLEAEGREFNGYLPRGILLNSPLWLMQRPPLSKADFLCFDFDRLTARLLGCALDELPCDALPQKNLLAAWGYYFERFSPACELRAECELFSHTSLFDEWLTLARVEKIYS